jgi:hypothetical protein
LKTVDGCVLPSTFWYSFSFVDVYSIKLPKTAKYKIIWKQKDRSRLGSSLNDGRFKSPQRKSQFAFNDTIFLFFFKICLSDLLKNSSKDTKDTNLILIWFNSNNQSDFYIFNNQIASLFIHYIEADSRIHIYTFLFSTKHKKRKTKLFKSIKIFINHSQKKSELIIWTRIMNV